MSDQAANLEILIQIRDELAGLRRTEHALRDTKKEATALGDIFRQGLGIGSGIAIATGAIALLKGSLISTGREAFRFAGEMKDTADALGLSTTRLQVLRQEFRKAGLDIGRLTMAVTSQTASLAAARDAGSSAAAAYRTLGLQAAQIEALPVDERLIAVTRAMALAGDKTAAFQAGAQILGARQLPQLLNAMRNLGIEGAAAMEALYRKQGLIMGDDTVERLDRAQKAWQRFWDSIVTDSGEALAIIDRVAESAQKSPGETWLAMAKALILGPAGMADLAAVVGKNTTPLSPPPPAGGGVISPPPLTRTDSWRRAELDLMRAQGREAVIMASAWETEEMKRRKLIGAIGDQIAVESRLLDLLRQTPLNPEENPSDRQRQIVEAENRLALLQQRLVTQQLGPKPRVIQAIEDHREINNANRPGFMTAGQGALTGIREWMTSLGSTGEQVAAMLQNTLGQTLSSLSADIWEAMKGTQGWGNAFKNVGNIAGRMLTQMIVQMTLVKSLQTVLGWMGIASGAAGAGGGGGGGAGAGAGGGTFVTSGPATLTVGDNPGGVELVNVVPISGKGRSWASGSLAHFAGGGSLLAGGGLRQAGGALAAPVHVSFNFATGLSASIRAEVMAMAPELRMLAIDAVAQAHERNQLKLT